jgi:hypothetical protein
MPAAAEETQWRQTEREGEGEVLEALCAMHAAAWLRQRGGRSMSSFGALWLRAGYSKVELCCLCCVSSRSLVTTLPTPLVDS